MTQPLIQTALAYLKGANITTVFGIVGGLLHPFFRAIEDDNSFSFIQTRHEENAAFMADGYARVSGRMAIAAATSGPGATNLITGVACAFTDGIPMLVITGNAATTALGKGAAQETNREDIDIVEMFRSITKYSAMITNPNSFALHFQRAMRAANSGRKGPVHLNIPVDLWGQQTSDVIIEPSKYQQTYSRSFDPIEVNAAIGPLLDAKRPVFLVGSGVGLSGANKLVRYLAERFSARVATSPKGKGIFPETHPLSLGVFGNAGHKAASNLLLSDDYDLLFTIGTSLSETNTQSWSPKLTNNKTLIQLDIDPIRIGRNYPVDFPLVGDAFAILHDILYKTANTKPSSEWNNDPIIRQYDNEEMIVSDHVPITPQRWRCDLQTVLPNDAVIFSDIGGHMLFNIHNLCIKENQRFYLNLNFGSMGHGTVAAMGAAIATDKPVFAIVGDGCFAMNGMELLTAVDHNIPVIWIVENNQMHGITHHCTKVQSGTPIKAANNRVPINIAAIAKAMGMRSYVVDRPNQIQAAVQELLAAKTPGVIEVIVESSVVPPIGDRIKTLAAFTKQA